MDLHFCKGFFPLDLRFIVISHFNKKNADTSISVPAFCQ